MKSYIVWVWVIFGLPLLSMLLESNSKIAIIYILILVVIEVVPTLLKNDKEK